MNVQVTQRSQVHKLRERAEEVQVAHGDEVRVDVDNVRVAVAEPVTMGFWRRPREAEVYFCNIGPLRIRERVHAGDGAALPTDATVRGFEVESSGRYHVENALIRSNGRIEVVFDDETTVRRLP